MARMLAKTAHSRNGYETCGCGRPQCRKRRAQERRQSRRVEKQALRKEMAK